jgi:hypothetical protein
MKKKTKRKKTKKSRLVIKTKSWCYGGEIGTSVSPDLCPFFQKSCYKQTEDAQWESSIVVFSF